MVKSTHKLRTKKPVSVFDKPLKADFKQLFKSLCKGVGHGVAGNWAELGSDTVETLSAVGLTTEPGELAFLLIRRSLTKALFDLAGESASQYLTQSNKDSMALTEQLDFSIASQETQIDHKFLDRPAEIPLMHDAQQILKQWLEIHGLSPSSAQATVERLPTYFVYALNQEWRQNAKTYQPFLQVIDTPFTRAGEREWAWAAYNALLQRRIHEGIFDEPFSLAQIYIPLNAYYQEDTSKKDTGDDISRLGRNRRRVVVSLEKELEQWLASPNPQDTIRVISGGPGSGKSSFARIFSARIAQAGKVNVLYVPLHLIDPTKSLLDEVGRFVKDEGVFVQNPLDTESPEPNLLIIFDGLDELASQGKAAAETARAFVREVERTVEKRNLQSVRLRILISGRELIVQENESEFRRPRQILTLLPYFIAKEERWRRLPETSHEEYHDPAKLLEKDLRNNWWKNYGDLTGKAFDGLPKELIHPDLDEITAQPLLNYLVALSFARGKLDFSSDINLNSIYSDLVAAVHERGYEKHRPYGPIRHMTLDNFTRVLEEIGLAAWHGDGRTTTVREIEDHCRDSGVGVLLDTFQEGAKVGVSRLLAAFFFRQYGQRSSGDPTFVFTHKTFGEYLTARRIVRASDKIVRELARRNANPDEGWDERDALKHWAQICGPSAMSRYLHSFLLNEMRLRLSADANQWQERLAKLFSYMLRHHMPIEQLQLPTFGEALFESRNAEEALLVMLNACAVITGKVSKIEQHDPTAFGTWFRRIQGQRIGPGSVLAAECLSFLNLENAFLDISDCYGANFEHSNLRGLQARLCCLGQANLRGTDLQGAALYGADLEEANLEGANLKGAKLRGARMKGAELEGAELDARVQAHVRRGARSARKSQNRSSIPHTS